VGFVDYLGVPVFVPEARWGEGSWARQHAVYVRRRRRRRRCGPGGYHDAIAVRSGEVAKRYLGHDILRRR
jgi:hypothetical protein